MTAVQVTPATTQAAVERGEAPVGPVVADQASTNETKLGGQVIDLATRRVVESMRAADHDEPEPVVRLAGEILAHFDHLPAEDAASQIATHVTKFWDPRMRHRLVVAVAEGAQVHTVIDRVTQILSPGLPPP